MLAIEVNLPRKEKQMATDRKQKTKKGGILRIYKSYLFREKDPVIDAVRTFRQDKGFTYQEIQEEGGPTAQTVRNWEHGKTKRPQFATVWASIKAMGGGTIKSNDKGFPSIVP